MSEQGGTFMQMIGGVASEKCSSCQLVDLKMNEVWFGVQGDPKKMHHKDSDHKSVLEVRFYFSTCVSESEFRARVI